MPAAATIPSRDIEIAARERIAPHVRATPVLRLAAGELGPAVPIVLKLEFLQHTGSFKPRGAFNRLLAADRPEAGVIAASGGNHGAAVAYAARALGPARRDVRPGTDAGREMRPHRRLWRAPGARAAPAMPRRWRRAGRGRRETGALEVHAYDDADVVAGQGTVGMEFEARAPDLTHVLVATGGGGLIGGIAAWYGGRVRVVSVEPEGCPTLHAALAAGRPVPVAPSGIAADSLGAREAGSVMFAVAQRDLASMPVLVSDAAIRAAQRLLWERLRIVAEPGGATALAALLAARSGRPGMRAWAWCCAAPTARRPTLHRERSA